MLLNLVRRAKSAAIAEIPRIRREIEQSRAQRLDDAGLVLKTLRERIRDAFGSEAEMRRIAEEMADGTSKWNREQFYKVVRSVVGVDPFLRETWLQGALDVAKESASGLIESLAEDAAKRAGDAAANAVRNGSRAESLMADIERDLLKTFSDDFDKVESRARLIARDQIGKLNGELTEKRQQALGITSYIWRTADDERVRDSHREKEGEKFFWNSPPADTGHPGNDYQCFPGSINFDLSNGCRQLWRHYFSGVLSSIVTVDGALLEATPNHPILTDVGWSRLDKICEGDYVMQAMLESCSVEKIDVHNPPTTFDEVFRFSCLLSAPTVRPRTEFNFHGDIPERDVYVVRPNICLSSGIYSGGAKGLEKFKLANSLNDSGSAICDSFGASELSLSKDRTTVQTHSCIGGLNNGLLSRIIHLAEANEISFADAPDWDGLVTQDPIDESSTNAVIAGKLQNADTINIFGRYLCIVRIGQTVICWSSSPSIGINPTSAEIMGEVVRTYPKANSYIFDGDPFIYKALRVIKKGIRKFSGHVFNAETETGWYGSGKSGVVSHNCRCYAEPMLEDILND